MGASSKGGWQQPEGDPPPCSRSSRREVKASRYRVEIPQDEEDVYKPSNKEKTSPPRRSTRRTRSDIAPRHITKGHHRDDFSDMVVNDYATLQLAANIEEAHSSSFPRKKSKRHAAADEEEPIIIHDTPNDELKAQRNSRRHSSERSSHVKQEDANNKNVSFSTVSNEANPDRKSKKKTTTSSRNQVELVDDDEPLVPKRHFTWMPFGHARTWSGIVMLAAGIVLATLAKRSTSFVTLGQPLTISQHMAPLTEVGLVRLNMCYSDDYLEALEASDTQVLMPYMNSVVDVSDETTRNIPHTSCYTVRLGADMIEDTMWEVSRLSASLAIALGAFFCLLMISTIRWESINMKPMAVGLLVTYLFQSFSFFFYDSQICREHVCKLALGTYLSILASFCWFGASMICILMDVHHTRKMRHLARLERRRRRRLRKQAKLKRKSSTVSTTRTETSSSDGGLSEHSLDSPPAVIEEEFHDVVEEGDLWQV